MVLVKSLIGLFVIHHEFVYFYLVSEKMSWTDARTYCRQHHTDLATVNEQKDLAELLKSLPSGFKYDMWIGLYQANAYSPWVFSDGSKSLFRPWYSAQPNNAGGNQFCVYTSLSGYWNDWDCADKLPFVCYTGVPHMQGLEQRFLQHKILPE
uniref:C-type lectin domain-containing protein n=1 Tax=Sinocyclocheilus rhinocerous TaxID=307959 RepID=A0A673HH38_9TELE